MSTKKIKLGLREQVNEFKKECFWREKMRALGWAKVPTVDGAGVKSWAGLRRKITQWVGFRKWLAEEPLAVVNEQLLTFNGRPLEK